MANKQELKKVLLVGADHIGSIPGKLINEGIKEIIHWNGRNNSTQNRNIPTDVDLIFLNPSYLNHGLMQMVKKQAKSRGIPVVFRRHTLLSEIEKYQLECVRCM